MTKLLEKAFQRAAKLPEEEQNSIANWLLAEFESESKWADAFAETADELSTMASEAVDENAAGETRPLNPDSL